MCRGNVLGHWSTLIPLGARVRRVVIQYDSRCRIIDRYLLSICSIAMIVTSLIVWSGRLKWRTQGMSLVLCLVVDEV